MSNKILVSRGSEWAKWDLHIHTPCSLFQNYGNASDSAVWEKFIKDLEGLPKEFKAIGICDYIFIEGYRKVLDYKRKGRLQNIDLILPVIELRIKKFAGNEKFKRINLHIIFADEKELQPDVIQQQFLNALSSKYNLSPDFQDKVAWSGVPTQESLGDLGKKIRATIPAGKQKDFTESDFVLGFNNLNIEEEKAFELLNTTYFKDKYITAIGKAEWDQFEWNDGSIAEKKTIINKVKLVFTASHTPESFKKAKEALNKEGVNDLLIDCSDAHDFSDAKEKDRIGNCFTWIKGDPTLKGLIQATIEPEDRIFIGDMPDKLKVVHDKKTKYIKSIYIGKKRGSPLKDKWFEAIEIPLNSNLVSIIGNKGSGKSALADVISLAAKTKKFEHFSFLNGDKFREHASRLAKHYEAKIVWWSGDDSVCSLNEDPKDFEQEKVLYIPQQYLEKICNEEYEKFEKEIEQVIFSHVKEASRLEKKSLEQLIAYRTDTIDKEIRIINEDLNKLNKNIISLETKTRDEYLQSLKALLNDKEKELASHIKSKPKKVAKPEPADGAREHMGEITRQIKEREKEFDELEKLYRENMNTQKDLRLKIESCKKLIGKINNFSKLLNIFQAECTEELDLLSLKFKDIATVDLHPTKIEELYKKFEGELKKLERDLDETSENNLYAKLLRCKNAIQKLRDKLDEPNRKYQEYKKQLKEWEAEKEKITGEEDEKGSVFSLKKQIEYLKKEAGKDLSEQKAKRLEKAGEIYDCLLKKINIFKELYKPVEDFVKSKGGSWQLKFEASIKEKGFLEWFFSYISQHPKGTFLGAGYKRLDAILDDTNFDDKSSSLAFLSRILDNLENDKREGISEDDRKRYIENQLRKNLPKGNPVSLIDFYNGLFSLNFLKPSFSLKLGDKEMLNYPQEKEVAFY